MTDLAPVLQGFFADRLIRQRQASPNTVAAYRDTIKLLLGFVTARTRRQPASLLLSDLDAPTIGEFLEHLQTARGNSSATRNARLSAIHSLFRYAAVLHPEHAALIQRVLAIPTKRGDRAIVTYLTQPEIDALLTAPNRATWLGRRDRVLLQVAVHTGLRVSELTGLTIGDVRLGTGPHLCVHGKGRKDRTIPLTTTTAKATKVWLSERGGGQDDPVFCTTQGGKLSRDAVQRLVAKHTATAAATCPSLRSKVVTPHTLRHTTAMALLHAGVDTSVIALYLGHESIETTKIYLHADMKIKEQALARLDLSEPASPGRYRPPDTLLAFLDSL